MRKLIAVAAVAASMMLPSYAARTVEISAYDEATREVSLAFGGSSSAAENVYIAYGPADCGGHFHKWPNSVNIGTIATGATTMSYTLPAAITVGTYYRFFVGDCPYDAEVEYIKGDKTSWMKTSYVPSSTNKVETEVFFDTISTGNAGIEAIYSARNTSAKRTFTTLQSGGNLRIDRKDSISQESTTIKIPTLTHYTISVDYSAESIMTNLVSASGMTTASAGAYTAGGYLALFTINSNGFNVNENSPIERGGGFRMYWFKMYNTATGNLDLDLIPVIVGGSPCMYDRVSGNVLPRLGAAGGAFTAGRELSVAVASSQTYLFGTLAVDSVNFSTGEISLSFPSLPTNATIWAVYGTNTDAGAHSPNGWDHYVKAADVAAGATSATFALQDLAGVSDTYPYKALRFVMAWDSGKTTPYDYQVEYIYAKTPNYVDTGIVPTCTDSVSAKVNVKAYGNWPVWSARQASNNRTLTCFAHNSKFFRFDRNNSYATQSGTFSLNKDYILKADYKTRIYNVIGEISGSKTGLMANPGDFTPGSSLYLFAANNSGSVGSDSNLYLYWFTLQWWDDSLKRDLIPVVKDGAACLYDKVTDAIMTQTGSFTAGARTAQRFGMDVIMTSDLCIDARTAESPAYARMISNGNAYSWHFYNLEMEEIANPSISLPDTTTTVIFGNSDEIAALLADRTANGWTAGGYKMTDFTVISDGYTFPAGFDFMLLGGLTLDLAGHDFTLPASMRDSGVAFTVTNSMAGTDGTLTVDIPADAAVTNDFITLSGNLEIVKAGAGEFFAAKTGQTYTGGTAISNGVFTVGGNGDTGVLGAGGALTVGAGATLEMNSKLNFLNFDLVLAGGTLANSAATPYVVPTTDSTFSNICLTATSTILINTRYGFSSQQGDGRVRLDLGGNVFHFVCDHLEFFDLKDVTIENGTIKTSISTSEFSLRGDCIATNNVTFDVGSKFPLIGAADTSVKLLNFINRVPLASYEYRDNDALTVYGAFKPITPYWHGLTMVDGATLDLSETEGAFSVVTKLQNATNLRFAEGATITVALTNRADLAAIAASNAPYVVTWPSANLAPASVTFQLDAETAAAGYAIAQDEYGIVLADAAAQATPFYAKMVKGEGDEYSWHFYNTLWNDITATAGVAVPNSRLVRKRRGTRRHRRRPRREGLDGEGLPHNGIRRSFGRMRGFVRHREPRHFRECDHRPERPRLHVAGIGADGGCEVHRDGLLARRRGWHADGCRGGCRDGPQQLQHCVHGQPVVRQGRRGDVHGAQERAYLHGRRDGQGRTIKGGRLRTVGHGDTGVLGAPCTVTVGEGAALDFCGRYRFGGFRFVLDGGSLQTTSLNYSTSFDTETSITDVRLTKDSYFTAVDTYRYGMYAAGARTHLDLGGCKLTITSNTYFDFINTTIENGTIETFGSGSTSMLLPRNTVIATNNVTFIIHNNINFFGDADKYTELANYVAMEDNVGLAPSSADVLHIWGSFVPHSPKYHGLTMMDGSTLDLSNLNAALATCSTGGTAAHPHSLLKFAENAMIRVNVGNRPLHKGDYLVTWTAASKPTNLNTVKFKCAGGRSFRVAVDEDGEGTDGLRFIPSGFMMIVK